MVNLYHFIVNPKSGSAVNASVTRQVIDTLFAKGHRVIVHLTKSLEHATELAHRIHTGNAAYAIVVAGGDGTVRSVAQGMADSKIPLLILPTGTENLLACELGLDGTFPGTMKTLEHGVVKNLDLGLVNRQHHFLAILGIGFDAEVVRRIQAFRKGHITHTDYLWPICRTFWEHKFPHLTVHADDTLICDEPALLFVSNISRYAVGLKIAPHADFGDGALDLTIYKTNAKRQLLLHAALTIINRPNLNSRLIRTRCSKIRIDSPKARVPIQLDGDLKLQMPLNIEVIPAAARVFASAPKGHPAYCPPRKFYYLRRWLLR